MNEETVFFKVGDLRLEGLYAPPEDGRGGRDTRKGDLGVVISHPHPQMGGCMQNNVVETMAAAFHLHGFSTLRFNFRGVGESEGTYDEGRGEQHDVRGAVDWLRENGVKAVLPAGYSFGAWVTAKVLAGGGMYLPAVFVAPPVGLLDFDSAAIAGKIGLAVCGEHDEFCVREPVNDFAKEAGCRLEILRGTDHFFLGREQELFRILEKYLTFPTGEDRS